MDLNGVWQGEYITEWFLYKTGREVPVPFVMKINAVSQDSFIGLHKTLFEGICQDDPQVSKITFHANMSGALHIDRIYAIKQYPRLVVRTAANEVETFDGLHPEIMYEGVFSNDSFSGTWHMNRTFRKINGILCELRSMKGSWWMKKMS